MHRHSRADTRTHRPVPGLIPGAVSSVFILQRGTQLPPDSFSAPPTHSLALSDAPPTLIRRRFPFSPQILSSVGPSPGIYQQHQAMNPNGWCLGNLSRLQGCCHSRPPPHPPHPPPPPPPPRTRSTEPGFTLEPGLGTASFQVGENSCLPL